MISVDLVSTVPQALTGLTSLGPLPSTLQQLAQPGLAAPLATSGATVLLVAQTDPRQNGLWVPATGAWARPAAFPTGATLTPVAVVTTSSTTTTAPGCVWAPMMGSAPIVVDTSPQWWYRR